jgi:NADH-quinone oxidoreductase subunit F
VCLKSCPHEAITGEKKQPHAINAAACAKCGICREECRFDAVMVS